MLEELPVQLTLAEAQLYRLNLDDQPLIVEKLQQAIRTQEAGICQIGLSLSIKIAGLLAEKP